MSSIKPIDAVPAIPFQQNGKTFHEFVDSTTFHGIKNIFDENHSLLRKIIWSIFVLGTLSVFAFQVGSRIRDYYKYETTVDVEVIYTGKLIYPTVTICNQNKFKLTEAASLGIYNFINNFYSTETVERYNANASLTSKSVTDSMKVYREVGHQKNDFIYSCSWAGNKCTEYDITETITEYGICYTFNSILAGNQTELFSVSESGMTNALTLLLNLEQYQYMPGPDNDAGVKMFLHDDYKRPLMYDLGFAIAAGTHSLVGVKRIESYSMAAPYGECVESKYKSHAECVDVCRMNMVSERCKCVPFEGLGIINITKEILPCNMSDNLICAELEMRSIKKDKNLCSCSVPCSQIVYDPALSYSSISTFSSDKVILGDLVSKAKLEASLLKAKEYGEIFFSKRKSNNEDLMKNFVQKFNSLVFEIKKIETIIYNVNDFKLKTIPDIKQLFEILRADILTTELNFQAAETAQTSDDFRNLKFYFEEIVKNLKHDWEEILNFDNNRVSGLINDIKNCIIRNGNVTTLTWNCDEVDTSVEKKGPTGSPISKPKLKSYWEPLEPKLNKFSTIIKFLYYGNTLYDSKFRSTFGLNSTKYGSSMRNNYDDCLNILNSTSELSGRLLVGIDAMKNENATLAEKLLGAENFLEAYIKFSSPSNTLEKSLNEYCFYFSEKHLWKQVDMSKLKNDFETIYEGSKTVLNDITTLLNTTKILILRINVVNEKMDNFYKQTDYNPSLTKKLIYQLMTTNTMEKDLLTLSGTVDEIGNVLSLYTDTKGKQGLVRIIQQTSDNLNKNIYWQFAGQFENENTTTTIPIPLKFPNYSKTYVNEKIIESKCLNGDWRLNEIGDCSQSLLDVYTSTLQDILQNMGKIYYDFEKCQENLFEDLNNYGSNLKVDSTFFVENFAKIDIFYKELSYQKIQQLQKFSSLSLFSEIGGFMGLLLGASVLTLCEWFDFLCVKALMHLLKKDENKIKNSTSSVTRENKGNFNDGYGYDYESKKGITRVDY